MKFVFKEHSCFTLSSTNNSTITRNKKGEMRSFIKSEREDRKKKSAALSLFVIFYLFVFRQKVEPQCKVSCGSVLTFLAHFIMEWSRIGRSIVNASNWLFPLN